MVRWFTALALALPAALSAATAAGVAHAIRETTFDHAECYRVRDLTLIRNELRIYLNDGYLFFSKPVEGRRIAAIFVADVEGGDGEVILMPPNKGERRSLASYIGSPNLNEHFRTAVFLGAGDLHAELTAQMPANPANRKVPEMAPLLDEKWGSVLHNLAASFETRLSLDLLSGAAPNQTLFAALLAGVKLGNFDVIVDPRGAERISLGQVANRDNRTFFDVWASFEPRNAPRTIPAFGGEATVADYRIEATLEPDLNVKAVTRVKIKPAQDPLPALAFDIARTVTIESVTVDGRPAEVLQRDALRENLSRAGNELFLVVPPEPLHTGRTYEFEFHHSGRIIRDAGDHVYYVAARSNWYPTKGLEYATYDLKFRYPRELEMVSAGDVVEDTTDGPWRITRRRTSAPIRMAGFNLGRYQHARVARAGLTVEVYANRGVEQALQPQTPLYIPNAIPTGRRRMNEPQVAMPEAPPNPTNRLQVLASDIADAMQFMAAKLGPPALPFLTVAPIPGTFGQGFPGLIYLSTLSYLEQPARVRPSPTNPHIDMFYNEILQAHEAAHQWWGNVVSAGSYRDHWLMEALANYTALLYLEKHKGARALETTLDQYRTDLLAKSDSGVVEDAGPIVLGTRLESSLEPRAWRAIVYGKGSWILHMLRRTMGDEKFLAMLAEICRTYHHRDLGTEEFRTVAARYLPPKSADPKLDGFFDQWIYGTGMPTLKLTHSVKGLKLTGTVTQTGVDDDFSVNVPIEIQTARGKTTVHWVRTSSEPVTFTVTLPQPAVKVALDPHYSILRRP